jgi:hypothetical protein
MGNPNGPSIEEIDDWNDALRDREWYEKNDPQSLADSIRAANFAGVVLCFPRGCSGGKRVSDVLNAGPARP